MGRRIKTSTGSRIHFKNDLAVNGNTGKTCISVLDEIDREDLPAYLESHGANTNLFAPDVWEAFYALDVKRKAPLSQKGYAKVGDVLIPAENANREVLLRPAHGTPGYCFPTQGKAGAAAMRIARGIKYKMQPFIYGAAGTGKTTVVREIAHQTNREFLHVEMREDLDPATFLGQREIVIDPETKQNVTTFVPGKLLKALEGHVGKDGVRRGVVILVDDIDRAPSTYHELFRHALDRNARKVYVQELGDDITMHPDTLIVATANSRGRGDDAGTYDSVQMMDDAILDRFNVFIEYPYMTPKEEEKILLDKFPELAKFSTEPFRMVMKVCTQLREMAETEHLPINFSHRRCEDWLRGIYIMCCEEGRYRPEHLTVTAEDWMDRYAPHERESILRRVTGVTLPS